jgi:hypothetical protein
MQYRLIFTISHFQITNMMHRMKRVQRIIARRESLAQCVSTLTEAEFLHIHDCKPHEAKLKDKLDAGGPMVNASPASRNRTL